MQNQPQVLQTYGFLNFLLQRYLGGQATFLLINANFGPDIFLFYLFIYLFIYSFVCLFIYLFIYLFVYLFMYECIYLFIFHLYRKYEML